MTENNPGPAYRIVTRRLVIRCWNPSDAQMLKEAIDSSIDHLRPWMPWAHYEPNDDINVKIERLRAWRGKFDLGQDFVYGIFDREESCVLGGTGLHTRLGEGALEIGYWVRAGTINRGLATETATALTRVAFEVNQVQRVEIHCDPANVRSAAVPRKLGYQHEATLQKRVPFLEDRMKDLMIWTLFREDFPTSPAAGAEIEAYDVIGRRLI